LIIVITSVRIFVILAVHLCEYCFGAASPSVIDVDSCALGGKGDVGYIHISPLLPFQVVPHTELTHIPYGAAIVTDLRGM
jgi:hypothetical protein